MAASGSNLIQESSNSWVAFLMPTTPKGEVGAFYVPPATSLQPQSISNGLSLLSSLLLGVTFNGHIVRLIVSLAHCI